MTLEAIGQKLKAARDSQGLSLRQIYERTKIPINHLQAIDGGQTEDLPEPVYVAGFIKRYAECIGLDGQVLADEYRREGVPANGNGNGKANKNGGGQPAYVTQDYLRHTRIDQRPPSYKLWLFNGVVIVVLVMVVSHFATQANTQNQTDPSVLSLKESASKLQQAQPQNTPQPGTNPAGVNGVTGATNPAAPDNSGKVTLSATKHVWVEIKKLNGGESVYTGYLEQGDRRDFDDREGLRVRAGNGGALSVEFKGKIEPFGQPQQVVERTFAAQNAVATTDGTQPGATTTSTGGSVLGAPGTTTGAKTPKKVVRKNADGTPVAARHRQSGDGYRSIGDGLDSGTRSIDVPYRYSEGRLDAN